MRSIWLSMQLQHQRRRLHRLLSQVTWPYEGRSRLSLHKSPPVNLDSEACLYGTLLANHARISVGFPTSKAHYNSRLTFESRWLYLSNPLRVLYIRLSIYWEAADPSTLSVSGVSCISKWLQAASGLNELVTCTGMDVRDDEFLRELIHAAQQPAIWQYHRN